MNLDELRQELREPSMEYRNEVRWWLDEGLHTDETLKKELQRIKQAGFGGVEFLAMYDPGVDEARYGWGSEEWIHDTQVLLTEATRLGMGVSMTSGTHWSTANLHTIVPDDPAAAKELDYTATALAGGETFDGALEKPTLVKPNISVQELVAVVAMRVCGECDGNVLLEKNGVVLTEKVVGERLRWTAPEGGKWLLFAFWMHGTGQTARPSCGTSYTINYIDRCGVEAFIEYWDKQVLTPALRACIQRNGRVQMYMDSLELLSFGKGGQFWGYCLMDEFQKRRGYDLAPFLPFVLKEEGLIATARYRYLCNDMDFLHRLRNDLYQTMTDLYMEHMLQPLQQWLHSVGMTLRAEISYGMPFEISQPGKYVDGVETESLEFASQIDCYRGMAGAAHLYNRTFSSETGASLLNYKKPLNFYQQIIFTQFAAGVVRTVMHGYASLCGSEETTQWPGHEGMWPIFGERFGVRQPAYRHYADWNRMIARYQYLLRKGKPRVDLAILRLDYTYDCGLMEAGFEEDTYENRFMRANRGLYWQDPGLQNAGYTYEYFAPQLLEDATFGEETLCPEQAAYRGLIVYQDMLPLSAAKRILAWAKQGLKVLLVDGVTENRAAGRPFLGEAPQERFHGSAANQTPFNDGEDEALADVIVQLKRQPTVRAIAGCENALAALKELGIEPRAAFDAPNSRILSAMREDNGRKYLYLYNFMYKDAVPNSFTVRVENANACAQIHCWSGELEPISCEQSGDGAKVQLTLCPGEATMLVLDSSAETILPKKRGDGVPEPISLEKWNLQVEDWNEGDRIEVTEDRGLGYVSREVYYETRKTMLDAGETVLKLWRNIAAIGEDVSGVGFYDCTFDCPYELGDELGAVLELGSTNGCTAAVYVNGRKADGVDFANPKVDITPLLVCGKNALRVEVSSTLCNRLRQRGYYARMAYRLAELRKDRLPKDPEAPMTGMYSVCSSAEVQDYGLTGEARIRFYRKVYDKK